MENNLQPLKRIEKLELAVREIKTLVDLEATTDQPDIKTRIGDIEMRLSGIEQRLSAIEDAGKSNVIEVVSTTPNPQPKNGKA